LSMSIRVRLRVFLIRVVNRMKCETTHAIYSF
jgi:hypothetical protein